MKHEMMGWQWHQLDHTQIVHLAPDRTMPAPYHTIFTGKMLFLMPNRVKALKTIPKQREIQKTLEIRSVERGICGIC